MHTIHGLCRFCIERNLPQVGLDAYFSLADVENWEHGMLERCHIVAI